MSPALQKLIDKGALDRLPISFSTFFFDQIKDWDLLFPAEQSYHERLFGLLDRSDTAVVETLFLPLRGIEKKMGVNEQSWPKRQFTLDQIDFLNRSPFYPEWRKAIAEIFGKLDPALEAEIAKRGRARLIVVLAPADLPVGPDRMWTRIAHLGKRIALDNPGSTEFGPSLVPLAAAHAAANEAYSTWVVEAGESLDLKSPVRISYAGLQDYRKRLMSEVQHLVQSENIRGPRELGTRLKQLKLRDSESDMGRDPVLAEFARVVLLAGNGTLLINNTFVEWSAVQAIRRARPSLALISFGIRNKIKPFTNLLIYSDQEATTPVPTQMDTLGSYVDLEVFYQYIWQECEKYPEYRHNTAYLFVGEGMDEMLAIAPPDFPLLSAPGPVKWGRVHEAAKEWLRV